MPCLGMSRGSGSVAWRAPTGKRAEVGGSAALAPFAALAPIVALALITLLALTPAPQALALELPAPPHVLFGELFERVQLEQIFPESKDFADAAPKFPPQEIMARYRAEKPATREALRVFV